MSRVSFVALLVLLGCEGASKAEPEPIAAPCEGCVLELPQRAVGVPIPLVVVLHGDKEQASKWFERWRGPALERGFGVLALQCPEELGCTESCWYRWNGNPSWVLDRVHAVAEQVPIDRAHSILVGWSGGATYLGTHADRWQRDFGAFVIHGGGVAPAHGRCPERALPAYFFVGDGNLYHAATKRFRDYFERCGSPVDWDVVERADHEAEDRLLDERKVAEILEWATERTSPRIADGS